MAACEAGPSDFKSRVARFERELLASSLAEHRYNQRAAAAVSNAAATVTETVATPIRRGADQVRGAVAGARRTAAKVDAQKESLSEQVRMRPFAALGVASVVGYVLGRVVR